MAELDTFREETRAWLEANCPDGVRQPGFVPWGSSKIELDRDTQAWLELMAEKGWTVPTWPREYGGAGLSKAEYMVLGEEIRRIGARAPLTGRGINYIGPTILEFGTDHQKTKWLPRMARGEGGWCMGYSEPAAGSDLANLKMKCVDEGDVYRLNGQKLWTSDGIYGDWIFCLVRTDFDKPKHEGISLILVNMDQPGVTIKPIRLLSGASPFAETFFDDATADKDDMIGPPNEGWAIGKRLLQYERSIHGGVNTSGQQVQDIKEPITDIARRYIGIENGRLADRSFRTRLVTLDMNQRAYKLTQQRVIAETEASAPTTATSILKVKGAEFTKEDAEVRQAAMGINGAAWDGQPFTTDEIEANANWLTTRAVSIYGGTSEIQRNIIAKRVLGLPD